MRTRTLMAGLAHVAFVVSRVIRVAPCVAALAVFSACGDRDVTQATPIPDATEVRETPTRDLFIESLLPAARWPGRESSPPLEPEPDGDNTAAAGNGTRPTVPEPVADAGVPLEEEEEEASALDCSAVTRTPASYELLEGFTSSEDFVFDELGNYVGIDDDQNLVRVSRDRERKLWVPKIGLLAGMGTLPDGSVVFCEVEEGALKRIYPNGSVVVVLGGLLYPNGLDIGPDGFVYVAENNGGRVRRVNPDTGEFTIVAMGLQAPNGVAFSNDPQVLYVGSFDGSGIYKVEIPSPGELGRATVFARPPGAHLLSPVLACPDQVEGAECGTIYNIASKCQALANVIDCLPVDPCPGLEDGEYCDHPADGVCRDHACDPLPTCKELGEGAACEAPGLGRGTCQVSDGYDYCAPPNSCDGLNAGARCEDAFSGPGVCETFDDYTYCMPSNPCEGLADGAACQDFVFGPGTCEVVEAGEGERYAYCQPPNPCEGLEDGAACDDPYAGPGVCQTFAPDDTEPYTYCAPPNPCDALRPGAACEDPLSGPGVCLREDGYTYCGPPGPCATLGEGAACDDPYAGPGSCRTVDGYRSCAPPNSCDGLSVSAACEDVYGTAGECADNEGTLYCAPPDVCLDGRAGDPCQDPLSGPGACQGGVCVAYQPTGGGIDGLGVDACGNVYASEYIYGKVWRISPAGRIELLAELPSAWIPNIKWGRDLGGFSSDVMYVADRERKRLFGIYVGVPGATEFFAAGQ